MARIWSPISNDPPIFVPAVELWQRMTSDLSQISALLEQLMAFIGTIGMSTTSAAEIELAIREALVNAAVHGNHCDKRKHVDITCRCTVDGEVSVTIRDQGIGFDPSSVPNPTATENRLASHGRGIYLMRRLMDRVWFERSGTEVHMFKRVHLKS